ncbi:MAG: glycoside hydrolase family 2 protein [Lachnospiraceae bacterium]|nr:glycoside hydrolase family 2 protein [Lachnospiraceae bacterium]
MIRRKLTDNWTLTVLGENVYNIPQEPISTCVPSSVYSTLLDRGLMPDPFYRDNELQATKLMKNDFVYETTLTLTDEEREKSRIYLHFDGIDTLADVFLDGELLGSVDNMNRAWEFDITALVKESAEGHVLRIVLHSPTQFIQEAYEADPIGGSVDAMPGFPHIRKAACMFGWDWGPRLPDAGLFRPVSIVCADEARIESVYYAQEHHVTGRGVHGNEVDQVEITAACTVEFEEDAAGGAKSGPAHYVVQFLVISPDGSRTWSAQTPVFDIRDADTGVDLLSQKKKKCLKPSAKLTIDNPQLWWPNGYGDQPLYEVTAVLVREGAADESRSGHVLDTAVRRIGLRTLTVNLDLLPDEQWDPHLKNQQPDLADGAVTVNNWGGTQVVASQREARPLTGQNFAIEVNGLQIFAMGADYIPEDNLLTRQSRARTDLLLESAREAHYNCVRIWGGGYFPDDSFYDLCDEKGLIIWQDFMFACAAYELTEAFEANICNEIRQQLRRLRHHACIGIWCGNNENEGQFETREWPKTQKQFYDYVRMYEYIIPKIVKEEYPEAFYWPSSQSSGGNFENTNAENRGDMHYWGVWHGQEPFTAYRRHHYRFLSEFGFQSFPALQTIERFTEPEDRNVFSRVMEMHQRNSAANGKILQYLAQTYLYPKNFDELVYCSQLLQAEAIRYGTEHFRRFRGTCMGTVVWQLNDIWPVASWASVDYYGNWKALHYAEKRMFEPVHLSCEEHGEVDQKPFPNSLPIPLDISADLHVANETDRTVTGTVKWSLRRPDSSEIRGGAFEFEAAPYSGTWLPHLDFAGEDPLEVHLYYEMETADGFTSSGTALFCAPKHYRFEDPELEVSVSGDEVTVTAHKYAKSVCVESLCGDVLRLDDNYVDLEAGTRTFRILPGRDFTSALAGSEVNPEEKQEEAPQLRVRSLYETAH